MKGKNKLVCDLCHEEQTLASNFLLADKGDWQGKLWGWCKECCLEYKLVEASNKADAETVFRRRQRAAWRLRSEGRQTAKQIVRASNYKEIFLEFERDHPGTSRNKLRQMIQEYLKDMATQIAVDIVSMVEEKRQQVKELLNTYVATVEMQAKARRSWDPKLATLECVLVLVLATFYLEGVCVRQCRAH